jgi:hypothetical protein
VQKIIKATGGEVMPNDFLPGRAAGATAVGRLLTSPGDNPAERAPYGFAGGSDGGWRGES